MAAFPTIDFFFVFVFVCKITILLPEGASDWRGRRHSVLFHDCDFSWDRGWIQ